MSSFQRVNKYFSSNLSFLQAWTRNNTHETVSIVIMLRVGLDVCADIGVKSWKYIVQESTTDYGDVHGLKSDFKRDIRGSIIPKYYYIRIGIFIIVSLEGRKNVGNFSMKIKI